MYGKHFSSMYEGSMVGAGAIPFAIMGYIIAHFRLDAKVGAQVRLNPVLLSAIIGEPVNKIKEGITFLCSPDTESTSKDEEGRRLVQIGEFDYRVVNGAKYQAIKNAEEKREANRLAQQRFRANNPKPKNSKSRSSKSASGPLPGENAAVKALNNGDEKTFNQMTDPDYGK